MIDFHSHILPGIDDGSRNVKMSLGMIEALGRQGVDTICATSHFYVSQRTPEHFLERRQEAYELLEPVLNDDAPRILLGAEVLYFPGISRMEALPSLCLEGSDLLLLEMPFSAWQEYWIREVCDLATSGAFTILMAHIERYYSQQPRKVWDQLLDLDVLMQSNADYFLQPDSIFRFRGGKKALKMLKEHRIHLLGTDAHNLTSRPPRIAEARDVIRQELGKRALERIDQLGSELIY